MNTISLESVLQRESFIGSANDNILPQIAIKAYVHICLASACLVCVHMQMWTHLYVRICLASACLVCVRMQMYTHLQTHFSLHMGSSTEIVTIK